MDQDSAIEWQRLSGLYDRATKFAHEENHRVAQLSRDIGKEKTQYFEKIALACAGTIALVVSFVGAHAGRLCPSWLLRSALVVLLLGMIAAMYRNWKFHYYLTANSAKTYMSAQLDRERCRKEMIVKFPAIAAEDGKPIDVREFLGRHKKDTELLDAEIKKLQTTEDGTFKTVTRVERAALTLTVVGMVSLVALAWINF